MSAPTLTEFLLARIAEDERIVAEWPNEGPWGLHSEGSMWVDPNAQPIYAPHARVLAECEAKRRIVSLLGALHVQMPASVEVGLSALALPYADHPDYDEAWRP